MFGSSSAFGSGSTFGSSSLFGSKPASTFGSGSSLFGSSSTGTSSGLFGSSTNTGSSLFGSSTSGFGSVSTNLGTKHAAWVETNQQEKNKKSGMKTLQLQSINGMTQYKTKSHEELRLEDLFNTAFSKPGTATTSGFGSGSMFGKSTSSGGGLFGSSTSTGSSIFGSSGTSSGGLFGSSSNTSSGFGGFGSSTTSSGGLFGSKPASTSGGLFGSTSTTSTGGGLFGNTSNTSGGLFGSSTNTGGGLFGSNTSSGGGLFGSSNTTNTGTSLFGNSSGGLGSSTTSSGGLFGSNNNSSGGLFGSSTNNTGSSLFGNSTSSGGLFGSNKSTGLFGNTNTSGGLFGSSNTGGGLFGNNNTNKTSSLFGNSTVNSNNNNANTGLIAQPNANPYAINLELAKEQVTNYTACPTKKVTIVRKAPTIETHAFGFVPKRYKPKKKLLKGALMNEEGTFKQAPELASSVLYSDRNISFTRHKTSYDWKRQYQKLNSRQTLHPLPLPELPKLKTSNLDDQNPPHFQPFEEDEKTHWSKTEPGHEDKQELNAVGIVERAKISQDLVEQRNVSPVQNLIVSEVAESARAAVDINSNTFKGDPTPKLSDPDIRTDPIFRDLCAMTERQLASVADFEIEHIQYGQIKWDQPVDLRGVNLDDIVCFSQSAFELYPNMDPKPKLGTGFMTPCAVMLYNVWPKGCNSMDRPSFQREERWRRNLEKYCRSCNYKDISYDHNGVLEFSANRDILM